MFVFKLSSLNWGIDSIFSHRYPRMDEAYYRRLSTFENFPISCPMTKEELAWAGFVYTGSVNVVKARPGFVKAALMFTASY